MKQGICIRGWVKLKHLIMKDFRILKTIIIISIIAGLLFSYISSRVPTEYGSPIILSYGIIILGYIGLMFAGQKEIRAKSDIIFNSFPVKRNEIVKAKYMSIILYLLLISGIVYIGSNVFAILASNGTTTGARLREILFVLGLFVLFLSVYLPFEFYNIGKVQVFNSIFYILLILLPNLVRKYVNEIVNSKIFRTLMKLDFNTFTMVLLGVSIISYVISLNISKGIYDKKEF